MRRLLLRSAVLCTVALATVGLSAERASASSLITPTDISTNFNNPIGLDYYQPTNEMLLSANFPSGQPFNFNVVHSDATHSQFSSISGLTDEVYLSAIRSSACTGGFTVGDVFVGTGTPGQVGKITNGGATFTPNWVQLPGEPGLLRGGLFQDRNCAFGGDLIVTTTAGDVWRVTSAGVPTMVASGVGDALEGPTTVPNDPRYGPWAGTILVSSEGCGCVESVTAAGHRTVYQGYPSAEGVHVVPAAQNFFGVDFADSKLVGIKAADLAAFVGDVFVATEVGGRLIDVRWNPTSSSFVQQDVINPVRQFEGTAFGPVGIANLPPPEPSITANGMTFTASEGAQFAGAVASFTDPDTTATTADYSASVSWGDGTTSAGTITGGGGSFTVSGSHRYAEEGTYSVTVTITDVDNSSNMATARSTGNASDAFLSAAGACQGLSQQPYSGPVASFTDAASPSGTLSDFSAVIDWGDGSTASTGQVTGPDGGPYGVNGSHSFGSTGSFTVTTTITDVGGSHATASCAVFVFAFAPGGGSFAIGDQNAQVGQSVEFWGAQWSKDNSLSGGNAPRSFKGFAEKPATPTCGATWTTDTGSSTPPPAGPLPAYMAIVVTSSVGQDGSTVSGNVVHIVIVKTNPGYAPDAGHPGTGTVVSRVC